MLDSDGVAQFGITESSTTSSDGTIAAHLSAAFVVPGRAAASSTGIPLLGLNPQINTIGGTLLGGQTLYYGVSAIVPSGAESGFSFNVVASVPSVTKTNPVTTITLS